MRPQARQSTTQRTAPSLQQAPPFTRDPYPSKFTKFTAIAVEPGYLNSQAVTATYTRLPVYSRLTVAGADPYNLTCDVVGPAVTGAPGPSGTVTFSDITTGQTLGTAPLGTATVARTFLLQGIADVGSTGDVTFGDFNGDGIPDVAVANSGSNTVSIVLGVGDGTFQSGSSTYSVGRNPVGIVVADFNNDGNLDIAVTNAYGYSVSILLGRGDGTFTPILSTFATGVLPYSLTVGDFNGDGKLDLAVADFGA